MSILSVFKPRKRSFGPLSFRKVASRGDEAFISGAECDPVYGPRIETLLAAHGPDSGSCDFWTVFSRDGSPVGAIARFYGTVYIAMRPECARRDEALAVKEFISTNHKWYGVECVEPFVSSLEAEFIANNRERSPWMYLPESCAVPAVSLPDGVTLASADSRLRDIYDIIGACHEGFLDTSDYDLWADDYESRISCGAMEVYMLQKDGVPVSCATINAVGRRYAILGSVSTLPAARGAGLGRLVCSVCAARIRERGLIPVLQCGEPELADFYRPMGYVIGGDWGSFET